MDWVPFVRDGKKKEEEQREEERRRETKSGADGVLFRGWQTHNLQTRKWTMRRT